MNLIVTTIPDPTEAILLEAKTIANQLQAQAVPRRRLSIAKLKSEFEVSNVLIITKKGPVVHGPSGEFFFHPGMSELRIKNIINGNPDHMVTAMKLTPGMSVLDCTLGLGTDAIVASFVTGENGVIVGLEISPVIAEITKQGLKQYQYEDQTVMAASRRIIIKNGDYSQYLHELSPNSFDVVYFDPMFRKPVHSSSGIKSMRLFASHEPITTEVINYAIKVAKQRVVIKEMQNSPEFERLGFELVIGGKYSNIGYGVMETGG